MVGAAKGFNPVPMDGQLFLSDFAKAVRLAVPDFEVTGITFRDCFDHTIGMLPKGRSYVYIFWMPVGDRYLKIGKAGPNSQARIYQHYSLDSAGSTLTRSIRDAPDCVGLAAAPHDIRDWIHKNTRLFMFIMPDADRFTRNFLEAFLHLKYNPVFEKG